MKDDYIDVIRSKVDKLCLEYGFGEIDLKIIVKDGKPIYVVFKSVEERVKIET